MNRIIVRRSIASLAALAGLPATARAQEMAQCADMWPAHVPYCHAAVQTSHDAQAQVGFLLAGGDPALGAAPLRALGGRLRLGLTMRALAMNIPDLAPRELRPGEPTDWTRSSMQPSATLAATFALVPARGTAGPAASVELVGTATLLQYRLVGGDVFDRESSTTGGGAGVRVGVSASPSLPRLSVSAMYYAAGDVAVSDVCQERVSVDGVRCLSDGHRTESRTEVGGWSGRASLSHAAGRAEFGVGAGHDRWSGTGTIAVRRMVLVGDDLQVQIQQPESFDVGTSRWTAFGQVAFRTAFGRVAAEAGWLSGGEAVDGFPADGEYDPAASTLFASVGFGLTL